MHGKRFEKSIRENDGKCSPIQIIKYHPHVAAATIIPSHWHSPMRLPKRGSLQRNWGQHVQSGLRRRASAGMIQSPTLSYLCKSGFKGSVGFTFRAFNQDMLCRFNDCTPTPIFEVSQGLAFLCSISHCSYTFGLGINQIEESRTESLPPERPSKWEWCSPQNSRERVTMTLMEFATKMVQWLKWEASSPICCIK